MNNFIAVLILATSLTSFAGDHKTTYQEIYSVKCGVLENSNNVDNALGNTYCMTKEQQNPRTGALYYSQHYTYKVCSATVAIKTHKESGDRTLSLVLKNTNKRSGRFDGAILTGCNDAAKEDLVTVKNNKRNALYSNHITKVLNNENGKISQEISEQEFRELLSKYSIN